ncbi:DUF6220 domain-containing protein [Cohnella sp. REN36]|uniref:DUF6220 domain-containing protein n=1 Tax=Cohnella sp. REN36 TaxID=2887347 RepID=UPI001D15A0E2|nr:DUF6220 domain-containing protein [Cohnella sp. REN36]MCC3371514.1 DUF6220 domain-containing protein [Cohnella sp. REN36]
MSDHSTKRTRGAAIFAIGFTLLAYLFAVGVLVQVFLAGMAIFVDSLRWRDHEIFVRVIEFVPLIMLILAFPGRLPQTLRWMCAGMFLLIFAQYFTAHFPGAGAFHPVIAALLFVLSVHVATQARRSVFLATKEGGANHATFR